MSRRPRKVDLFFQWTCGGCHYPSGLFVRRSEEYPKGWGEHTYMKKIENRGDYEQTILLCPECLESRQTARCRPVLERLTKNVATWILNGECPDALSSALHDANNLIHSEARKLLEEGK